MSDSDFLSRGGLSTNRRCLNTNLVSKNLLDRYFLAKAFKGVLALQLFKLLRGVLVEELVNGEETSTDFDVNLLTINLDHHAAGAKFVDT